MASNRLCEAVANGLVPLTAAMIYDCYESGCRGKALLDRVTENAGDEILFSLALWRADALASPDTSPSVLQNLERAMLLILALRPGADLPRCVFDWVECWAHSRAGDDSALAVVGSADTGAIEELEQLSQRRGIMFSCEPPPQLGSTPRRPQQQELILEPLWEEPAHLAQHYRHWGINE